jgi:hypothetical protein
MSWLFLEQKTVKCRKEKRCLLCNEPILKGESYVRRSGIERGEGFHHMEIHPECEQATSDWDEDDWESWGGETMLRGTSEPK